MSTIGDLCKRNVVVAKRDESLWEGARRMRDLHVGCLVVVDEGNGQRVPVGILTDRDIVMRVLSQDTVDLRAMRIEDAMTKEVISASEHADVATIATRMRYAGVRRVPVLDDGGNLIGIIAHDDLLTRLSRELQCLALLVASEQRHERRPSERQAMRD